MKNGTEGLGARAHRERRLGSDAYAASGVSCEEGGGPVVQQACPMCEGSSGPAHGGVEVVRRTGIGEHDGREQAGDHGGQRYR
jgi:hypothetical protein